MDIVFLSTEPKLLELAQTEKGKVYQAYFPQGGRYCPSERFYIACSFSEELAPKNMVNLRTGDVMAGSVSDESRFVLVEASVSIGTFREENT